MVNQIHFQFFAYVNFSADSYAPMLSLAAVSLLLERGPLPFFTVKKRPDSLFHETSSIKFFMETAYVA